MEPAQEGELAGDQCHAPSTDHPFTGDHRFVQAAALAGAVQLGGIHLVCDHGDGLDVPADEGAVIQGHADQLEGAQPPAHSHHPGVRTNTGSGRVDGRGATRWTSPVTVRFDGQLDGVSLGHWSLLSSDARRSAGDPTTRDGLVA